jgi:hypothetical protein
MSHGGEVERYVKDPSLLVELCREVIQRLDAGSENGETAAMEAQLREIARAIDKLDKQSVPVPDALRAEKTRLAAALGMSAEAAQTLNHLADELDELLEDLKDRISRTAEAGPAKKPRTKRSKSPKTDRSILRSLIIEALNELGGSAHKTDLYKLIEKKYEGRFLPGDFDYLPDGIRIAWKNYSDWEGTVMRQEGVLKANSTRGIWELSEAHR